MTKITLEDGIDGCFGHEMAQDIHNKLAQDASEEERAQKKVFADNVKKSIEDLIVGNGKVTDLRKNIIRDRSESAVLQITITEKEKPERAIANSHKDVANANRALLIVSRSIKPAEGITTRDLEIVEMAKGLDRNGEKKKKPEKKEKKQKGKKGE